MLPLHESVRITYEVETGEFDSHGNPITEVVDATVPAAVWPLGSSDDARDLTGLARYRMVLAPTMDIPPKGWSSLKLTWGPFDDIDLNYLTVDGSIDPVHARGRLHHYELTTKAVV